MRVPRPLRSHLAESDLDRIAETVRQAELRTSGEIRVHVVARLLPFENARRRAVRDFRRLGMDRTRDGTGVLLFLAVKTRRFEIVADRGIDAKVGRAAWEAIAAGITTCIRRDGVAAGLCHGVERIGTFLSEHFPIAEDDTNELSNEVSFGISDLMADDSD